jgi:outer membrane protein TolC
MAQRSGLAIAAAAIAASIVLACPRANAAALTLDQAIDRALRFAPSVEMAAAKSDLVEASAREQRAPLFPSLSAGTEYYQAPGYSEVITNRGLSGAMLSLDYTAWDWGRRESNYRAAQIVGEVARLGIASTRAQIVFDTTVAYYSLMRARQAQGELACSLDRLDRYVATIEQLRKSGRAIANDVLKIEGVRDTTRLALSAARSGVRRASMNLGAMFGDYDRGDIEIADTAGIPPLPSGDIAKSPAIVAAQRAIAATKLQVAAAKAERLPTFKVALTTGFLGIDPPATVNHYYGASYDGVISMPLYQGGLISARIDQARARELSANAQLRDTHYLLERRLTDAAARYEQARSALTLLSQAQPIADDAFALSWTRFLGGGNSTVLEVVDAYQQAEQLRIEGFNQDYAAREAVAETTLLYGRTK